MTDQYQPLPEHKFTFGLWTVGSLGGDPFGHPVRSPLTPVDLVHLLADVGAYGVNLHDNDLIKIDDTPAEREKTIRDFKAALAATGLKVPMATTDLFKNAAFKDGAFTSNDPRVRKFAIQKAMRAMDLGADLGAQVFVFWGGREGVETDAAKDPAEALKRMRAALNYLCEYAIDQGYSDGAGGGLKFALEAKPNEPRGDLYLPTTGAMLGFIATLDHPDMVGVNPEFAHEHMAGLNFLHAIAQAWDAGKLFHIDLNDQNYARFDQDWRFGMQNIKQSFFLVKFLEDVGYDGSRHFDAHALRTEDYNGVKDFARGCMRSYLILKEKAKRYHSDPEIQSLLAEINRADPLMAGFDNGYSRDQAAALKAYDFDLPALTQRAYNYERLDQLTMELLMGVRQG
jgi:xylose isomerase